MLKLFFKSVRVVLGGMIVFLDKVFPPRPVRLSAELQKKNNEGTQNLSLYQFPACPFCIKVRRHCKRLGIRLETRNVLENEHWHNELETLGGKRKVPCLRIEDEVGKVKWLYESEAINAYLTQHFAEPIVT